MWSIVGTEENDQYRVQRSLFVTCMAELSDEFFVLLRQIIDPKESKEIYVAVGLFYEAPFFFI